MQLVEALLRYRPFTEIAPVKLQLIASKFHERIYKQGQMLIKEGELVESIGIICSGRATAFFNNHNGTAEWFCDLIESDFYGEIELLTGHSSILTIVCIQSVVGYFLSADEFLRLTNMFPDIKAFFNQIALKKMSIIINKYQLYKELSLKNETINPNPNHPSCIQKALDYIEINYGNPISLDIVARKCGTSKYHLSRLFKNSTGQTFKQYLNHKRITEAKRMMQNHGMNVTEICYASGFNDLSYFSRLFKEFEKVSPSKFRRILSDNRNREKTNIE